MSQRGPRPKRLARKAVAGTVTHLACNDSPGPNPETARPPPLAQNVFPYYPGLRFAFGHLLGFDSFAGATYLHLVRRTICGSARSVTIYYIYVLRWMALVPSPL